jgi:dihydrofolate reductase / thymidylate synthase
MEHFKKVTIGSNFPQQVNAVIMGRKTWESIPAKFRPLPDRQNVVLTRQPELYQLPEGVLVASSLQDASQQLEQSGCTGEVFVIGGAEIYQQALAEGWIQSVLYTEIDEIQDAKFDSFFPELAPDEWDVLAYGGEADKENGRDDVMVDAKSGIRYRFLQYTKKTRPVQNLEEMQYLDLCRDVMEHGIRRGDRTGTGTLSKFGTQMRFSLRDDALPLLTTKRTFWRGVAEELLWFVKVRPNVRNW